MTSVKENKGIIDQDDDDDDDDDEECSQNINPATPLRHHQHPSSPLSVRAKGTDAYLSLENIDNCDKTGQEDVKNGKSKSHNLRGRFSKISNNSSSCDDTSSSTSEEEECGEAGETGLPIVSSTSSRFSTLTKNLPLFHQLTKKRKKRKKKFKDKKRISEITWAQKVEAVLVAVSAFTSNVIIIGFITSLAIYYVEFKQAFAASHAIITLSVFLPTGVFGSVGLLSGIFLNKFGVRITGITGSLLLGIGVGACAYANNVIFLFIFLGVFAGSGCSLVYLSITMGTCAYFKHQGRLLMPLVTMGEAVGAVVFPPLTSYLINIYFWRGSLLMMSGVMLQAMVCAVMYSIKNLQKPKDKNGHKKQKNIKSTQPSIAETDNLGILSNSSLQTQENTPVSLKADSSPAKQSGNLSIEELDPSAIIIPNTKTGTMAQKEENSQIAVNGFLAKESRELEAQGNLKNSVMGPLSNSELNANTSLDNDPNSEDKEIRQRDIFLAIVKNKQYMLFLISVCIITGCINTTLTVLPDFCVSQGLTLSESANVYAIGASGDIIARIIGGWLLYRDQLSSLMIFTLAGTVTGLLVVIYPLLSTFYLLCVLSFFLMIHSGLLYSVYSVVVLDFFDLKKYAIAIGLSETVAGIGVVAIGYIIGLVTEYNDGNYTVSFYLLSVMSVASMLPIFILYLFKKRGKVSTRISTTINDFH